MGQRNERYDPTPVTGWSLKVLKACGYWRHEPPRIVLTGPCPRCHDPQGIDEWIPDEVPPTSVKQSVDSLAEADIPDSTPEEYVTCHCRVAHTGAPDKTTGCGGQGFVKVVIE